MPPKTLIVLLIGILFISLFYYYSKLNSGNPFTEDAPKDNSLERVLSSKELRVGSALEELPWGKVDPKTGKEIGAEVEIAKLVADKLSVKLVLVNKGFDYLLPDLLNKQYDVVIAGMSITNERKKLVNFTGPYLTTGLSIIVRKDNQSIKSVSDLEGKKVGTLSGTTSHEFLQTLKNVDVRAYDDPGKYITETINGNIDATVYDATAANNYLKENPSLKVTGDLLKKEQYGMAVRKGDVMLLNELNLIISEIKDSDEFKKIIQEWYGPSVG